MHRRSRWRTFARQSDRHAWLILSLLAACQGERGTGTSAPVGLNVTGLGAGSGTVVASAGGLSCRIAAASASGSCFAQYSVNTAVTLTATADDGSAFGGWSGACTGTAPACQLTLSETSNVQATFNNGLQSATVGIAGNGAGSVVASPAGISCARANGTTSGTCTAGFASGTSITLTASAAALSVFGGWSGDCAGSTPTCVLVATGSHSVEATFLVARNLTVVAAGSGSGTVTAAAGGINCSIVAGVAGGTCTAPVGDGVTTALTATADSGSVFSGWTGACSGIANPCLWVASADTSVHARFDVLRTLTVSGAGAGAGTVTSAPAGLNCSIGAGMATGQCVQTFPDATSVTLTAAPTSGSTFTGWTGACTGSTCVVQLIANGNVVATFAGASSAANSTVAVSPATVPAGTGATVTVTVKDGAGNAVPGATVTLSVATGAAMTIAQPAATNAAGVTTGTVSATASGARTIAAVLNGSVTVAQHPTVTVSAGPASSIASTGTFVTTGARFGQGVPSLPAVAVHDAFGNPVPGASVTFTITKGHGIIGNGSGTGTSVPVLTDASGTAALSQWTLTSVATAGNYDPAIDVNNVVTAAVTGVAGSPVTFATSVTVSYATDVQAIWNQTTGAILACSAAGCHASGASAPVLAGSSRANLNGVYITAGDSTNFSNAANRLLYRLISGVPVMPEGYQALPANVIGIVKAYIKQGAPNN